MASPKLSILICTMPSRKFKFAELLVFIQLQSGDVEILIDGEMGYNIGTKRNKLLERATGEYIVFVDDDDYVSSDYVNQILNATIGDPDSIGISGIIKFNGDQERQWHISKEYGRWYEENGVYYRTPNHISPVRRELALQIGFKEVNHGEDFDYSMRLLPLLKTENIINKNIYFYDYFDKQDV